MDNKLRILRFERYFRDPLVGNQLLRPNMTCAACENIRIALRELGYKLTINNKCDEKLEKAVLDFQIKHNHHSRDGFVGPGTRRLLTEQLVKKGCARLFMTMKHPEGLQPPTVFISYAWRDSETVNKIDQWLRDHDVRVLRDTRNFSPGKQLPDAIAENIAQADKIIAIYSARSKNRDWPKFEITIAEQTEQSAGQPLLIYLILDNTTLPKHDLHRLAIKAKGRRLREVGQDLLMGILGRTGSPLRYKYDENERL